MEDVATVLHEVRVWLYANYLPKAGGAYIAHTANEAMLGVEEVCAALKNRGGFTGNLDDLVEHVKQFFDEMAYQLCDGFAVNTGYFSIHPNVGGTFDKVSHHDSGKHPITFKFRVRAPLRTLVDFITIHVAGLAQVSGYIDEFIDVTTEAVNETLTPGGMFNLSGQKIKVAGNSADIGVYFVSETDPVQRVKVAGHLAHNSSTSLIGIIPALSAGAWKVEVVTQFTGSSNTYLKIPRTIAGSLILTV
jgi:hypothetical protein